MVGKAARPTERRFGSLTSREWFRAQAYVAATGARDAAKDINLGSGAWSGGISDGTTLWFINDYNRHLNCLSGERPE